MVFRLLLLYSASTLLCSRKKERKERNKTTLFFHPHSFIHSFQSIHLSPTQPTNTTNLLTTTNPSTHPPTQHQHAHPTNPPPRPPPPPPPLDNPQPRHPRHLQPNATHLSNLTNFQRIFPPDLEFSFRYARTANFGGDFSGDCGVECNFFGGSGGLWEWEWEWEWGWKGKGDGMFFFFLTFFFFLHSLKVRY